MFPSGPTRIICYLARLTTARIVLWCYFLWYVVAAAHHFESTPRLWLTSFGLAIVIGIALVLNTASNQGSPREWVRANRWAAFRFFLTPFCVSSFAALVKGKGFILIVSPRPREVAEGILVCASFVALTRVAAWLNSWWAWRASQSPATGARPADIGSSR